jgi:hypothetical protein
MGNHEPQHELDLHLNLSAPIPSSALSRIGQDFLSGSVQMAEDQHPSLQHPVIELGIQAPLGGFQLDLNDIGHPLEADLPVAEDAQLGHHEEQEHDVGHIDQIVEQGILDAEEGVVGDDNQAGYMDIDLPELLPALQNPDISANLGTFNMNLNINMAITQFDVPGKAAPNGLTFMERKMGQHNSKTPPDVFRLWAKFFSPVGYLSQVVNIPADWAAFFIMMLLSPTHFDWAKSFLASQAWKLLTNCANSNALMAFAIPAKCPENVEVSCQNLLEADVSPSPLETINQQEDGNLVMEVEQQENEEVVEILRKKKGKGLAPLVETEARRSPRIRSHNFGFKHNSCAVKNCLACAAVPPTLSKAAMKTVGEEVCKIKAGKMEDEELLGMKRGKSAIGDQRKKKPVEKNNNSEGSEGQDPVKKAKK